MMNEPRDAPEFVDKVAQRRKARMTQIDRQPADVRALVHEYGWTVVNSFLLLGIKKAAHIKHLVETVLNEFSPTRGSYSSQGRRGDGDGVDGRR